MKKIKSLLLLVKSLFRKRRTVERFKLTELSNEQFLQYSKNIICKLSAHPAGFPSPPPSLKEMVEMQQAIEALEAKTTTHASMRRLAALRKKLRKQLQALASYYRNAVSSSSGLIMAGFRKRER